MGVCPRAVTPTHVAIRDVDRQVPLARSFSVKEKKKVLVTGF